jgi:hypothetical protein
MSGSTDRAPADPLVQLALIPLRNAGAQLIEDSPQRVVLAVAKAYSGWLGPLPKLLGAPSSKRFALDGLALVLWRRIDDRRSLGELIDWLAEEQQLGFHEARLLTLQWLHQLATKGLVVLGAKSG